MDSRTRLGLFVVAAASATLLLSLVVLLYAEGSERLWLAVPLILGAALVGALGGKLGRRLEDHPDTGA